MQTELSLISKIAREDRKCNFNNLAHLLNIPNLMECFEMLKVGKACGVDRVSLEEYGRNLHKNLEKLVERMKSHSYKPKPVRRVYIPKTNGKQRPLGIPSIEDKIVQMGITRILVAIYEEDFLDMSYGFRPKRNCHDALDRLDKISMRNRVNHIIDVDIKGFFDNVDHKCMQRCLEERVSDKNLLRLIFRFLKAGVMEEGQFTKTETGTPQGGILSPVLANIYLHYVLDLWIEKVVKPRCQGYIEMVRYADDFVICVQYKKEVSAILEGLKKRLSKFHLEIAVDKSKIIEFGKYSVENAKKKGRRAGTFNFLGFTHYCDKGRKGAFKMGRKTEQKKFLVKMKEINNWLKTIRNTSKVKDWWPILCSKLRGHFQYYGVSGNYRGITRFYFHTVKLLFKWLNRRSQKRSFNWQAFNEYINRHNLPKPKIYHNMYTLYGY